MNIKGYRASKKLTQEDAAALIGKKRNSYLLKENGKRDFSLEEGMILSRAFGITIEEFYRATKE